MIRYHVAGETYQPGEALICRDTLIEAGYEIPWKWEDADEGFDGDVVCLFGTLADAQDFRADHGGTILEVSIPEDCGERLYQTSVGYITPRLTRTQEGYEAMRQGIPAEWITEVSKSA